MNFFFCWEKFIFCLNFLDVCSPEVFSSFGDGAAIVVDWRRYRDEELGEFVHPRRAIVYLQRLYVCWFVLVVFETRFANNL